MQRGTTHSSVSRHRISRALRGRITSHTTRRRISRGVRAAWRRRQIGGAR